MHWHGLNAKMNAQLIFILNFLIHKIESIVFLLFFFLHFVVVAISRYSISFEAACNIRFVIIASLVHIVNAILFCLFIDSVRSWNIIDKIIVSPRVKTAFDILPLASTYDNSRKQNKEKSRCKPFLLSALQLNISSVEYNVSLMYSTTKQKRVR